VRFLDRDGATYDVRAPIGSNLLEVAHKEDIDLEGACEGSLACSTCHLIVEDQAYFDKIPEASDDENDMLDLAFGLTETCAPVQPGMRTCRALRVYLCTLVRRAPTAVAIAVAQALWHLRLSHHVLVLVTRSTDLRLAAHVSWLCRSRLGCQIIAEKDLDGLVVRIPDATRNFAVDGHRPKPH
jgi:ferredoxin